MTVTDHIAANCQAASKLDDAPAACARYGARLQQWKFASAGSGYYTITNVDSGTVLDSVNCGTANGTAVDLWSALGNFCQEWRIAT